MRPIGLSSRTISPVSVIHAVVVMPLNVMSTLNAGIGRRVPAVTTSRAPIAMLTGAFFIVAGSNTAHCRVVPGVRPSAARRRPTLSISAGVSISWRVSVRVPDLLLMSSVMLQAVEAALDRHRAGAGIEREVEVLERERAIDVRGRLQDRKGVRAEQRELQAAVFLQLEAIFGRLDLADGEADLLAAVVDAAPLRGRSVAGEIGREVPRRSLEIGAIDHHAHGRDPRDEGEDRQRTRDGPR